MKPANLNMAINDAALLEVFLGDDREAAHEAFRDLVHRYERLVWTVCRRQLDHHSDIEDAFQTTFMQLSLQAAKIRKPQALSSWLYGVALKSSLRIRRQRLIRKTERTIDDELMLVAPDETPFEAIHRKYRIESIDHQLSLLDERYRTPLVLYYFAGLSIRDIAHQLGISRTAAEGRLRRGRARLRVELAGQGILASPGLLPLSAIAAFQPQPEMVAATCELCIATLNGTAAATTLAKASLITGIDTGTKLMIIKCLISTAIAAMIAVGGLMHVHQPSTDNETANTIALKVVQEEEGDSAVVELSDEHESLTPGESLHQHLHQMHHHFFAHLHEILGMHSGDDAERFQRPHRTHGEGPHVHDGFDDILHEHDN